MKPNLSIRVPEEGAGERLDRFLARELRMSRGYVRRMLQRGLIRIAGRAPAKGAILRADDRVEVLPYRHPEEGPPPAPDLDLPTLHVAGGLLAIDKPAGLPTHPLDFEETRTALNAVLVRFPEMRGVGEGGVRSGVVHRLDTGTSGVLVFATSEEAWRRARECFRKRAVGKRYLARVHGELRAAGDSTLRLAHRGDHMAVVRRGGREALTRLRVVETDRETSLIEARPVTGLMHQIRVTLSHLGHPIVGDRLYGSTADLGRHLLHATSIRIHSFFAESPPPPEILGREP